MIRFTWHRFRTQALVALGALAVLAVVLAITGIQLARENPDAPSAVWFNAKLGDVDICQKMYPLSTSAP